MRRGELSANLLFFAGPLVFGVVIAAIAGRGRGATLLPLALWIVGFCLFAKAKWSRLCEGRLTEFGCGKMTPGNKAFYLVGYLIMILGVAVAI